MMKKILSFAVIGILSFPCTALANINIFACEPEWAALAKEIGGEHVDVTPATTGTQDPHHISARPSLLAAMRQADMVVCTGAGLELGWLPILMRQAASSSVQPGNIRFFMTSDMINLLNKPQRIDRAMGDIHPEGDPHINTDPRNYPPIAKELASRLGKIDSENAASYNANLLAFTANWEKQLQKWQTQSAPLQNLRIISHHENWTYLNRWLGLRQITTLENKPGIPPTTSHLEDVLRLAKAENVKIILLTPFDNDQAAEWLAPQIGAKIIRLPFTVGGTDGADDLTLLFDQTIALLNNANQQ